MHECLRAANPKPEISLDQVQNSRAPSLPYFTDPLGTCRGCWIFSLTSLRFSVFFRFSSLRLTLFFPSYCVLAPLGLNQASVNLGDASPSEPDSSLPDVIPLVDVVEVLFSSLSAGQDATVMVVSTPSPSQTKVNHPRTELICQCGTAVARQLELGFFLEYPAPLKKASEAVCGCMHKVLSVGVLRTQHMEPALPVRIGVVRGVDTHPDSRVTGRHRSWQSKRVASAWPCRHPRCMAWTGAAPPDHAKQINRGQH